jgi:hypothetical protein
MIAETLRGGPLRMRHSAAFVAQASRYGVGTSEDERSRLTASGRLKRPILQGWFPERD